MPVTASEADAAAVARLGRAWGAKVVLRSTSGINYLRVIPELAPMNAGVRPMPETMDRSLASTPEYAGEQDYGDLIFGGLSGDARWRGIGVRLSDVEYAWNLGHEDFADSKLALGEGQPLPDSNPYYASLTDHGTAVAVMLGRAASTLREQIRRSSR